jgi:Domain of unknown function (DUF397)
VTGSESAPVAWRKSSASTGNNGDCVEVAFAEDGVLVRHSRNPSGPMLLFTPSEWRAFVTGAQNGEFELPDA